MVKDSISDMLTRIRNASLVRLSFVFVPYSTINFGILKVLLKQGYIENFAIIKLQKKKIVKVVLRDEGVWIKFPFFSVIKRISKPGKKVFSKYTEFFKKLTFLKSSPGIAIISTSSGVMTHIKAQKLKKGGEILCYVE